MNKLILLIDDELDLAEVIGVCLESFKDWKVRIVNSGKEALSIVEDLQPDAILLDVMMPEMDGIEVYQHLQANSLTQHIPVILLTAKVQSHEREHFDNLSVAGIIAKPFDPVAISDHISQLLNW